MSPESQEKFQDEPSERSKVSIQPGESEEEHSLRMQRLAEKYNLSIEESQEEFQDEPSERSKVSIQPGESEEEHSLRMQRLAEDYNK